MHRKRFMPGMLHTAQRQIYAFYVIQKLLFLIHADILRYAVYHSQWGNISFSTQEITYLDVVTPIAFQRLIFADVVDYEIDDMEYLFAKDIVGYVKTFKSTTQIRIVRNRGLNGNAYEWVGLFMV